jgi:hypothetical protein
MLSDIFSQPQKAEIENKSYFFEYNHASLAMLEKRTNKSPYEIYDCIIEKNKIMLNDSIALTVCAMQKNHNTQDILDMENLLRENPGVWYDIKEAVVLSFIAPMTPPSIVNAINTNENSKKKIQKHKSSKQNMIG